mgnify:FL=1
MIQKKYIKRLFNVSDPKISSVLFQEKESLGARALSRRLLDILKEANRF